MAMQKKTSMKNLGNVENLETNNLPEGYKNAQQNSIEPFDITLGCIRDRKKFAVDSYGLNNVINPLQ